MLLSPRPTSIARNLLRLATLWLCLVLLVQTLSVAVVQAAGPLHRHSGTTAVAGMDRHERGHDHDHDHSEGRRHHHAAPQAGVVPDGDAAALDDALSAAAAALVAAMALLAPLQPLRFAPAAQPVRPSALAWAVLTAVPRPLLKPPRAAWP